MVRFIKVDKRFKMYQYAKYALEIESSKLNAIDVELMVKKALNQGYGNGCYVPSYTSHRQIPFRSWYYILGRYLGTKYLPTRIYLTSVDQLMYLKLAVPNLVVSGMPETV